MKWVKSDRQRVFTMLGVFCAAIVGTIVGVVVGYDLTSGQSHRPHFVSADRQRSADILLQPTLRIGERFPSEGVTDRYGATSTFEMFFDGTPTVLLFWSLECGPCIDQANLWNTYIEPALDDDVKQVVCLSEDYRLDVSNYEAMLKNKIIVFVDYGKLRKDYNLVVTPTIVSLDGQGLISHIQLSHNLQGERKLQFDQELTQLLTGRL